MLARRGHTRRELALRLRRKGYPAAEAESTVAELAAKGWVDDRAAAEAVVLSGRARGKGAGRIRAELLARGVGRADTDAALAAVDPAEESARLNDALRKREGTLPARLTGVARSKKLFDHLVRRGFAPDAVRRALREKGDSVDDDP